VRKRHSFRAGHELPDLLQSLQFFVIHVDHHTHASMIDQNHLFRLILYWKRLKLSKVYYLCYTKLCYVKIHGSFHLSPLAFLLR
jgi:hypothetical protein